MEKFIAQRNLLYSMKSEKIRHKFTVGIGLPQLVDRESASFKADDDAAVCKVVFDGLDEQDIDIYGADLLHALALAVDIDPFLKGLNKKYDFYWLTGEPYFDEI